MEKNKVAWKLVLKNCSEEIMNFNETLKSNGTKHMVPLTSYVFIRFINIQEIRIKKVFHDIIDFFVPDVCSKHIFCSKLLRKAKIPPGCLNHKQLLQTLKVAQNMPRINGTSLTTVTNLEHSHVINSKSYRSSLFSFTIWLIANHVWSNFYQGNLI